MKAKKGKEGSALLLVLVLTTFICLLTVGFWYKTSLLHDIVLQKEVYAKRFYLAESFLDYGCSIAKRNFEHYIKHPMQMDLGFLLNACQLDHSFDNMRATLDVKKNSNASLLISFVLYEQQKEACRVSCKLVKTYEDQSDVPIFMVQNFTIGNPI